MDPSRDPDKIQTTKNTEEMTQNTDMTKCKTTKTWTGQITKLQNTNGFNTNVTKYKCKKNTNETKYK